MRRVVSAAVMGALVQSPSPVAWADRTASPRATAPASQVNV
jgi:hypothetical protein